MSGTLRTSEGEITGKPKLAVFHERASLSLFEIAEAARGLCDVQWIVGWSVGLDSMPVRGMARFGEVVDVFGMSRDEAVDHIVSRHPDGVIIFTDPPLGLAAAVAERVGAPFHDTATVRRLRDKLAQRNALEAAGLDVPAFAAVHPSSARVDGPTIPADFPFPAVLKPRAGAGSRDTFLVDGPAELQSILASLQDEDFLVEERIGGRAPASRLGADMVSVESILEDGTPRHVAVTGRFPLAAPFRETGSFMPSDLGPDDRDAVMDLATRAAAALGARVGVLHTEIKLTPDGPRVIEVNGRLGGGIARLLSRLGGPQLITLAMRSALGLDVGPLPAVPSNPVAYFLWVLAPGDATVVDDTEGVTGLRSMDGIEEVRLNRRRGDPVDPREGGSGHVVAVEGKVATHDDLMLLHDRIDDMLALRFS